MRKIPLYSLIVILGSCFAQSCAARKNRSVTTNQSDRLDRLPASVVNAVKSGTEKRLLLIVRSDGPTLNLDEASQTTSGEIPPEVIAAYEDARKKVVTTAKSKGVNLEDVYSHLPIIKFTAKSLNDLVALVSDDRIMAFYEDIKLKHTANENLDLIRQPEALTTGFNGSGTSVAILDTGLDYKRAAFGPCTSPGVPAATCRVAFVKDFATDDKTLDDGIYHGTNVSGIIASVAPGTKVIGLDVFDGDGAYNSDILSAINWVIANKKTYNIAAMNMSFGSFGWNDCSSETPTGPLITGINNARAAGILAAVASGNEGSPIDLDYPACGRSSVSVGAVYDRDMGLMDWDCKDQSKPDVIACFSNLSQKLTIFAPGVRITAAGITMTGTSQATPHVAGAIAVLRSAYPNETPDQIVDRLTGTGKPIPHPQTPIYTPRLDLAAALSPKCLYVLPKEIKTLDQTVDVQFSSRANCQWNISSEASWIKVTSAVSGKGSGKLSIQIDKPIGTERTGVIAFSGDGDRTTINLIQPPDTEAPTGTLTINGNLGSDYTSSRNVSLVIDAKDINSIKEMCISNTNSCTDFIAYNSMPQWVLSEGDGNKTVYLFLRDSAGNTSKPETALTKSIIFDGTPPTDGKLVTGLTLDNKYITLDWSGFTDPTSPVKTYRLVYSTRSLPASCADGDILYDDYGISRTHGPLTPGTYYYRVCARNTVKLLSDGVTATVVVPIDDKTPPVGNITMNGGATFTTNSKVNLSLTASDASSVTKMCVSTSTTCNAWEAYATTKVLDIGRTQGNRSVYVWFEDGRGNRNTSPYSASIIFDSIPPSNTILSGQASKNSVKLSWTTATDANGIASYKLVYRTGAVPPKLTCTDGTSIPVTGLIQTATVTNLVGNSFYSFRICATDRAGNVANGGMLVTKTTK